MIVPVFKPSINRKDMDSVLSCMVSDEIGPGVVTSQFEKAVSDFLGIHGALAFREQAKAMETALDALEYETGGRILLSPLSPGYYIRIILDRGLEPFYVDVDSSTGCMDVQALKEAVEAHTPAAIFLHHPLGSLPDAESISSFGIPLIEDISTTFGAMTAAGKKAGSEAKHLVVTLEEDGIITAAGGSMFLSCSRNIFSAVRKQDIFLERSHLMTNMNAALGIIQLKQIDSYLVKRREIREVFVKSVMKTKHRTILPDEDGDMIPYSFPVVLRSGVQNTIRYAAKHGIRVVPAFEGCAEAVHPLENCPCPNAEAFRLRCVLFPLYPRLAGQNIQLVSKVLSTLP